MNKANKKCEINTKARNGQTKVWAPKLVVFQSIVNLEPAGCTTTEFDDTCKNRTYVHLSQPDFKQQLVSKKDGTSFSIMSR